MSLSLQLRHGDLALNGNAFATVSGGEKLTQDLRCALLTPIGSYEEEPTYGASLEEGVIGEINWNHAATLVQTEISRVCADYQRQQIARNQRDAAIYGRLTIDANETLLSVENIDLIRSQDRLLAKVTLKVGAGVITLSLPISL